MAFTADVPTVITLESQSNARHDPSLQTNNDNDGESLSLQDLEKELPVVEDGQVSLSDLLSRVVQAVYSEMTEIAETMPSMSDQARKRTLADFCVRTKKQIAKLYAVMRWSRDAALIQKCMNVTAFILSHANLLDEVIIALSWTKDTLGPAQLRNHDLLTALDVLATGTYTRLPSMIKDTIIQSQPLSASATKGLVCSLEDLIRFRLRTTEILPSELSNYRIESGRVTFNIPHLFITSVTLSGSSEYDYWLFLHVEFLCSAGGASAALQDFPTRPTGLLKQFIQDEANSQLRYYTPIFPSQSTASNVGDELVQVALPKGVVNAPLVRLYNFLRIMSLSYQLEIICFQANRLRSLGWSENIKVHVSNDRKDLKVDYWFRKAITASQLSQKTASSLGGTLHIRILSSNIGNSVKPCEMNSLRRILSHLRNTSQLDGNRRQSDAPESSYLCISWHPAESALNVTVDESVKTFVEAQLSIDPSCINFEELLLLILRQHSRHILATYRDILLGPGSPCPFSSPDEVTLLCKSEDSYLQISFTRDNTVLVSIDARTGKIILRAQDETGTISQKGKFLSAEVRINQTPHLLADILAGLRYQLVLDEMELKASYLGLQCFRQRNLTATDFARFGKNVRGFLFIQLHCLRSHYLTVVVTDYELKFCLVGIRSMTEGLEFAFRIKDFGWIDLSMISFANRTNMNSNLQFNRGYSFEASELKELYFYCCARADFLLIEQQLEGERFPYSHVSLPSSSGAIYHGLAGFMPAICVEASAVLAGAEGVEAVERNICIIPISWRMQGKAQKVLVCMKLKGVHATLRGKESLAAVIRPSSSVFYDNREGMIAIISSKVDGCILRFLNEWSKVSKMISIAQQVSRLAERPGWFDVRLLDFDLNTLKLEYYTGYGFTITCRNSSGIQPAFDVQFFHVEDSELRLTDQQSVTSGVSGIESRNPHKPFASCAERVLAGKNLSRNVRLLVQMLRLSLPSLLELQSFSSNGGKKSFHWFPKGLVWWRALFHNSRFGLDFRIRPDFLLEITDLGNTLNSNNTKISRRGFLTETPFIMRPIPELNQACRTISLRTTSLHVVPLGSGILVSSFDVHTCREVIRSLLLHINSIPK